MAINLYVRDLATATRIRPGTKEDPMSIMDQVKTNLREWYALAADRTGDMAKISVRMYDKYGISREIERQLSELGSYVYHAVQEGRTDFAGDTGFQAAFDRIKGLEGDLEAKMEEIEEIKRQRQQRQAEREQAQAEEAAAAARREAAAAAGEGENAGDDGPAGEGVGQAVDEPPRAHGADAAAAWPGADGWRIEPADDSPDEPSGDRTRPAGGDAPAAEPAAAESGDDDGADGDADTDTDAETDDDDGRRDGSEGGSPGFPAGDDDAERRP
jgi:hypothetical protein